MTTQTRHHPLIQHAHILHGWSPDETDQSDLEILGDLAEGARVVGLGEGAHFVQEFAQVRARLVRFLVESCGFTHVALEIGRGQAALLEPWLLGDSAMSDFTACAGPLTRGVYGSFLRWLHGYNAGRASPVRLVGPDLPNTLTLSPDLDVLKGYLQKVDPESLPLLAEAQYSAGKILGESAVVSALSWGAIEEAERDRLSARLSLLTLRFSALESLYLERSAPADYALAKHHLEAARHTDHMLRALRDLFSGTGLPGDTSIRDRFAATALSDALGRDRTDLRVLVLAHNNHIQKTPVSFDGELTALPLGYYLSREIGDRYRAVGLTHLGQRVPEMSFPRPESPVGFEVSTVEIPFPAPGSIEHALIEARLSETATLVDLRTAAGLDLKCMRSQSATVCGPLQEAFDAVVAVPQASREPELPF